MNEGALTLTDDKMILYANKCFARMVKCPMEQTTGSSFLRFLSDTDRIMLRPLMKKAAQSGSKLQILLHAIDGSTLPVQISVREMEKDNSGRVTIGMVVTDMTEARRTEELLRALNHRAVEVQEAERGRVALELHDNITQLLCAVVFRSQALADKLSTRDGPEKQEAIQLGKMLATATEEVERISRNLRPSILDQLGLDAVLRDTTAEFAKRTGISVKLRCAPLSARLPGDTELALYRILQQVLANVETHAQAHHVAVTLTLRKTFVELTIKDDGLGFDSDKRAAKRKGKRDLGLAGMRERAAYVGGTFTVKSARGSGTEIDVRIPLTPSDDGSRLKQTK
jgi:PAS domain S-box-containing protein